MVLQWIADGCPDGVMEGYTYKTTALALQNRRLVTISRKGGTWKADATAAGRYYLEHGAYPAALPVPGTGQSDRRAEKPKPEDATRATTAPKSEVPKRAAKNAKRPSVTEQLVADVVAAGGELHVNRYKDRINWSQRVDAAIRFGKVPDGKLLVIDGGRDWSEIVIRLQDAPDWMTADLAPIPVPDSLRGAHQVVAELRSDHGRFAVTSAVKSRGLRLVQALVAEASRRGYVVRDLRNPPHNRGRGSEPSGLFAIAVQGHAIGVDLQQLDERRPHTPSATELRRAERESWYKIPRYDRVPSSRLLISLTNGRAYRRSSWSHGETALEQWLPQILQEIELRAGFAEEQRLQKEREEAEKQRHWEAAMAKAKRDLIEARRADRLLDQLERWIRSGHLRDYVAAMARSCADIEDDDVRQSTAAWIEWARSYADAIDPLRGPLTMPVDPEPTPQALEPFLGGWSAYGPYRDTSRRWS